MSADFKELNEQLRFNVISLLHSWLPGGRVIGREFTCGDFSGKKGNSLKINVETTLWSDFSSGDKGGDLISLYARIKSLTNIEAYRELSAMPGISLSSISPANSKFPKVLDVTEYPPEIHEPPIFRLGNIQRTAHWVYRNEIGRVMFYIARFDIPDKGTGEIRKEFRPYCWIGGVFKNKMWPSPRPLYGLELSSINLSRPICLVEGEKAADAAREIMGNSYVVMTWPGGAKAVDKVDWSPLTGRDVLIWPDNDDAGMEAAREIIVKIIRKARTVKIIEIQNSGMPAKWDAADALNDGWDYELFKSFARPLAKLCHPPLEPQISDSPPTTKTLAKPKTNDAERSQYAIWTDAGIQNGSGPVPPSNLENCIALLQYFNKKLFEIWTDTFYQTIFIKWQDQAPRPWQDLDQIKMLLLVQRHGMLKQAKGDTVMGAAMFIAERDQRNEPKDWMNTLKWDGVSRLSSFLHHYLGSDESGYASRIGQNFWVSMVARVMSPGCKADNMLILEGVQGARKSTALSIIGGQWFTEADEKMGTKDFYGKIQGKLIIEIAELDSFHRTEITAVKNTLTQRVDRFRPPYGRNTQEFPRQCIFVGTTNDDNYLNDPTGARRFWPILVTSIDQEALKRDRDQLFAEAVHLFKQGQDWWEVPKEETEHNQGQRSQTDPWDEFVDNAILKTDRINVTDILIDHLHYDRSRVDRGSQFRVAAILKRMGWRRAKRRRIDGKVRPNEWERPVPLYTVHNRSTTEPLQDHQF